MDPLKETLFPGERGRRHNTQGASSEYDFKPHRRRLEPEQARIQPVQGRRHLKEPKIEGEKSRPEMRHDMAAYTRSGNDIPEKSLDWDSMGRVEWPDKAKDARYFISKERILEVECGMKVKVGSMRQQRNGIERRNPGDKAYAFVDYSPGYFKTENANPDGPDPGTTTVPDKVGDGINYRPQPSYEQKKAARMKAAEVDGVMSLSVPPGGEDSDDES
mmetsp:Transcript_73580/g.209528  ORF Transcript_73580/g.209528 Transcript_73580/m.209528 type:complete len:217 (-) Transcript_73580:462-1112(-)